MCSTLPCPLHSRDKRIFPDTKLLFCSQYPSVLHQWWKYLKHLALSSRVHIDQNGGCSNNLELIEDHTDSLVAVEAVRVVLHQLGLVFWWFRPSPMPGAIRVGSIRVGSLSAAVVLLLHSTLSSNSLVLSYNFPPKTHLPQKKNISANLACCLYCGRYLGF